MFGRLLYNIAIHLSSPYILWRLFKRYRGDRAAWREYWGFCPRLPRQEPVAWVHAVSLGEATAAQPLVRHLQAQGYQLLLTYTTPAGRDFLRQCYPQATITALPLDFLSAVRRFFHRSRPAVGIIMEAEYWPNLLFAAKESKVRLMLANARLGKKNARRYRLIASLMRRMVACFDVIAAQTPRDAGRLRCYGARHSKAVGNLKFDLPPMQQTAPPLDLDRQRPVVLWACTRAGEEQLLLAATDPDFWRDYFVILAPRHPHRRDEITALADTHGLHYQLRTVQAEVAANCQLYIADTLGEMQQWYYQCSIAVIGGSFLPYGGQNPIEAMHSGRAAIAGPHMENYQRLVRQAVKTRAMLQASDGADAVKQLRRLLADKQLLADMQHSAQAFYKKYRGAWARHMQLLEQLLTTREGEKIG